MMRMWLCFQDREAERWKEGKESDADPTAKCVNSCQTLLLQNRKDSSGENQRPQLSFGLELYLVQTV